MKKSRNCSKSQKFKEQQTNRENIVAIKKLDTREINAF